MNAVPLIRYACFVAPLLLGLLFLFGEPDKPVSVPASDRWTAVDSLRAMAHLGEPVQGHNVRTEQAASEPAGSAGLATITARESALIMNAQASMDAQGTASQPAADKPRKRKIAARQVRVRTAAAESAQRAPADVFRPPSW
jgi:hypothetical protein